VSEYLRPVSLDDPDLIEYLAARGWLRDDRQRLQAPGSTLQPESDQTVP
jgi:hypothetical protein